MNLLTIHYFNMFLGAGAILFQVLILYTFFALFFDSKGNVFLKFVEKHFLPLGFLISFLATILSLVYSNIINFAPCYLCWFQRIFLFPQVFLFGVALWDKPNKLLADRGYRTLIKYSLPMLCVGSLVAIYHNFTYYFASNSSGVCDVSGVSCYQHLISEFGGYISFPMLSLTIFLSLISLIAVIHFYKK